MSSEEWPRDFDELELTKHAIDKMKQQTIGTREVRLSIEEGEIHPEEGNGPEEARYRLEVPGVDLLTVVNREGMVIKSTFWDEDQGKGIFQNRTELLQVLKQKYAAFLST
jgi:hypothetical protein